MHFVRYPFFFVNTIFMIFGIVVMSYGILLLTNYSVLEDMLRVNVKQASNYSESDHRSNVPVLLQKSPAPKWLSKIRDPASYLLIAFGAAFFTLSFIGCCGTVKDSRGLMIVYASILVVIVALQITGIWLYVKYKPDLKAEMVHAVNAQYKSEEMRKFTQFEFIMDLLMVNYKCCGVINEKDFKDAYANFYSVRSLPIDPRTSVKFVHSVTVSTSGESEMSQDEATTERQSGIAPENFEDKMESRVVTGQDGSPERQVPVTCCKLNITSNDAVKLLRNIYRKQDDKLQLLDYAIDDTCVTEPSEANAYVGDSHGCFDKIQGEVSTILRIGLITIGLFELCALVFAFFIFKTAYYDWLG